MSKLIISIIVSIFLFSCKTNKVVEPNYNIDLSDTLVFYTDTINR